MGRRAVALIIATLVALIGVVALFVYVKSADARAVAAQEPTKVWVTTEQVTAGTPLKKAVSSGQITQTTVAKKGVPDGALKTVNNENQDLVAVSDIAPGSFVLADRFGSTPQGVKAIEVPKGRVAISVQLSDPARVGKFVTPGSHIVIYDTHTGSTGSSQSSSNSSQATNVLLDDVLVIAMGQTALGPVPQDQQNQDQQNSGGQSFLVTVALTPDESIRMVHAINTGKLYAGLRGPGVNLKKVPPATDNNLFAAGG